MTFPRTTVDFNDMTKSVYLIYLSVVIMLWLISVFYVCQSFSMEADDKIYRKKRAGRGRRLYFALYLLIKA